MTAMNTSLKASLVAIAIAASSFGAHAAGLGAINVFSGLGQPLRAEIELKASAEELQSLSAKVASVEAFRQANVTYSSVMPGLRFGIENRGNRAFVTVRSDRPVNEPFLALLVELNWSSGRLLREYTFLLDPVEMGAPPAVVAGTDVPVAEPARRPVVREPQAVRPAPQQARAAAPAAVPAERASEYQVKRGDTLRAIASRYNDGGANLDQMLVALLRANPQAFDGGNINRLRAGAILNIPDAGAVNDVDPKQARREVVAQSADFQAYRNRIAGAVAARPAQQEQAATRESAGQIVAKVDAPAGAAATGDRVEVSSTAAGEGADANQAARLRALEEEVAARERALDEANSRVAELERNIHDLQKLIELKNEGLAQVQRQAAAGSDTPPATPATAPAAAAKADLPVEKPAEPVAAPQPAVPAAPVAAEADKPVEKPAEKAEAPASSSAPAPAAATPSEAATPAKAEPAKPAAKPAPKPPVRPAPAPAPEPTFVESLLENPLLLAGGGGILALLLAYAGFKARSRRQQAAAATPSAALTDFPVESESVFKDTGGQSVDTGSSSVIHTDFSQSGLAAIDADEGVDPVAEADVYMAYGRDAQAEEILLDALKADPSRGAIYLKLLEIYAQRNDQKQFEAIATDLYSRSNGAGGDWEKAASLGRKLDPTNPLYAKAGSSVDDEPATEPRREAARAVAAGGVAAGVSAFVEGQARADEPPVAAPDASPSQLKDTWTMPGDLSQFNQTLDSGSNENIAQAVEQAEQADAAPDFGEDSDFSVLDFDLDMGAPTPAPEKKDETAEAAGEPQQYDEGLTFDLDVSDNFGSVVERSQAARPADNPADAAMMQTVLAGEQDYAAAEAAAETGTAQASGGAVNTLDLSQAQSPLIEAPVQAAAAPATDAEDDDAVMDLEKTGFDNSLLDFGFDLNAPIEPVAETAPELELTSFDLDLEMGDRDEQAGAAPSAPDALPSLDGDASPTPDLAQEVDTKLDLARAYQEMGDSEGARELVEEVLRDGTAEQREAANRLLAQLA